MKKTTKLIMTVLMAMGLLVGCGNTVSTSNETTTEAVQVLDPNAFDATTGAVTADTEIVAGETGTTIAIAEGTVFQDSEGNPVTQAPSAAVTVTESNTEATTNIEFKVDGETVIPSEPVTLSIPAPNGAQPGDEVQVEVPDGVSVAKVQQKLIFVVVGADGTINITVLPEVFQGHLVIVVVLPDASTN